MTLSSSNGMPTRTVHWTQRYIAGNVIDVGAVPAWLPPLYEAFERTVLREGYPCYFGQNAVRNGDIYLTAVSGSDRTQLPTTLQQFLRLSAAHPRRRNNLAVFFEPTGEVASHGQFQQTCWDTLQHLHDADPEAGRANSVDDPDHPLWEFPFGRSLFFVVGLSPSYQMRRSRNPCPAIVMLFQPRDVFADASGAPLGEKARAEVRERLRRWDHVPVHDELGVYGDADNREWRQYFLSDSGEPTRGACPLRVRNRQSVLTSDNQAAQAAEEHTMMNSQIASVTKEVDRDQVIAALTAKIGAFMEECDFFRAWQPDTVSKANADKFLLAFDHLVGSFPALIAVGLARLSEAGRVVLAKNLFEECGNGELSRTHHAIYRNFLQSAQLEYRGTSADRCTHVWRTMLWQHTLVANPASSVGAIAAGEFLAQPALGRIFDVLKPLYPGTDIEYFTAHLQLETEHVQEIAGLIASECRDQRDYEAMLSGFETGLRCWGDWFDGASSLLFTPVRRPERATTSSSEGLTL